MGLLRESKTGGPPLTATFSFWATVVGMVLSRTKHKHLAATLLLLVGYGGVGVAWERACRCDVRRLGPPPAESIIGALSHAPMLLVGHRLLRSLDVRIP